MNAKTTKLNVKYIRELMSAKGMDNQGLAYFMGRSPGLVKRVLEKEIVDIDIAVQMSRALNVDLLEIVTAY